MHWCQNILPIDFWNGCLNLIFLAPKRKFWAKFVDLQVLLFESFLKTFDQKNVI